MSILFFSPIKFNSKRVKNKNGRLLNGKPLYQYSLDAICEAKKYFDDIKEEVDCAISTEDISKIDKKYMVVFDIIQRPKELSEDPNEISDVLFHTLETLLFKFKKKYDIVILVQPSNPFVEVEDIINCYELHKETGNTIRSVSEIKKAVWNGFADVGLTSVNYRKFIGNGSIVIISEKRFKEDKSLKSLWTIPYIMPQERSIDIDTELDFKIAELILKERRKNECK